MPLEKIDLVGGHVSLLAIQMQSLRRISTTLFFLIPESLRPILPPFLTSLPREEMAVFVEIAASTWVALWW